MEEVKTRLSNVLLDAEAGDGLVKFTVTGNREVKVVEIDETLMSMADTYQRATEDQMNANELRKFSEAFAKKMELFG